MALSVVLGLLMWGLEESGSVLKALHVHVAAHGTVWSWSWGQGLETDCLG